LAVNMVLASKIIMAILHQANTRGVTLEHRLHLHINRVALQRPPTANKHRITPSSHNTTSNNLAVTVLLSHKARVIINSHLIKVILSRCHIINSLHTEVVINSHHTEVVVNNPHTEVVVNNHHTEVALSRLAMVNKHPTALPSLRSSMVTVDPNNINNSMRLLQIIAANKEGTAAPRQGICRSRIISTSKVYTTQSILEDSMAIMGHLCQWEVIPTKEGISTDITSKDSLPLVATAADLVLMDLHLGRVGDGSL